MEELLAVSIYINSAGKICFGRPLVPLPPPTPKDDAVGLAGETILTDGVDNNGGGQEKDNPRQDGSGKEEDKPSNDDDWKISGAVDK